MTERRPIAEVLATERLTLHRPVEADIAAILRIHRDPRTCVHNPSDGLRTIEQATRLFHRWNDQWSRFGIGYLTAREHGCATVLGFCGVKAMLLKDRPILNLFYRLDPAAWGHGYASEAARSVVGWAGRRLPGPPIVARVRPRNTASQRVATKAGLTRAPDLDGPGSDGIDWIYVSEWPE
ncbi:GNAT family N-acetyltransferase [Actinoalloteichus hymeniacidonis]|uniref:Acetyltransferase, ribosomal protein N-acetylase n=1 Tax=Actinoalloteichus hymeniacidonis TaxID=340345 RepID=A0AAC9HQ93_9PSEU|nr:GNAT family N-acetyltransferase [Actinoalloteichus hymeniacidonis]AOS63627.1 acetyltransferase, ribosomal protein N-acetylase [Actinoalloteichus hymeniacidonis]MBB5908325.1 RimJ/RimL family protein N-acetyltransferase [Actinoalloteichus hymeniacidonis]